VEIKALRTGKKGKEGATARLERQGKERRRKSRQTV
jgi:hypothetical protein